MSLFSRPLCAARSGLIALLCTISLILAQGALAPAHAEDDSGRSTFTGVSDSVMGIVGSSKQDESGPIEYRERAPLVIPPKLDLPPPAKPIAKSNPAWPADQEAARKKKKSEEARAMKPNDDLAMSPEEMRKKRDIAVKPFTPDPCPDQIMGRICNQEEFWNSLKVSKKDYTPDVVAGQEPPREYLTQPPKGYMAANKIVKPTFEARKEKVDLGDARAQIQEEARRKNSSE